MNGKAFIHTINNQIVVRVQMMSQTVPGIEDTDEVPGLIERTLTSVAETYSTQCQVNMMNTDQ